MLEKEMLIILQTVLSTQSQQPKNKNESN
jgi:hypothetical protein